MVTEERCDSTFKRLNLWFSIGRKQQELKKNKDIKEWNQYIQ